MNIYQPYTYLIGWSIHSKYYYGVRYSKKCKPSDLWKKYFTSSKYVKYFREQYGEPDIIEIRKIFCTAEAAILWEQKVLSRLKCAEDTKWLNKSNGGTNIVYTDEITQKMSKSKIGKKRIFSEQHKTNIKIAKTKNPHRWTDAEKLIMSKTRTGRTNTPLIVVCPNCNKSGGINVMNRWHFNNCKHI